MSDAPAVQEVATPVGPARVHLSAVPAPHGLLALGHGAGGGVEAPDLLAAARAATDHGWSVALVEQPWRVAGRRVAEAPARLDAPWRAALDAVRPALPGGSAGGPLVVGGRSAGARVACRTAGQTGADAVLALAFPLHAPSGRSRDDELRRPSVPRLVVQGGRDAFGVPTPSPGVEVHVVEAADHGFAVRRRDGRAAENVLAEVRDVVGHWLQTLT